jgi:hypothetical protein
MATPTPSKSSSGGAEEKISSERTESKTTQPKPKSALDMVLSRMLQASESTPSTTRDKDAPLVLSGIGTMKDPFIVAKPGDQIEHIFQMGWTEVLNEKGFTHGGTFYTDFDDEGPPLKKDGTPYAGFKVKDWLVDRKTGIETEVIRNRYPCVDANGDPCRWVAVTCKDGSTRQVFYADTKETIQMQHKWMERNAKFLKGAVASVSREGTDMLAGRSCGNITCERDPGDDKVVCPVCKRVHWCNELCMIIGAPNHERVCTDFKTFKLCVEYAKLKRQIIKGSIVTSSASSAPSSSSSTSSSSIISSYR